MFCDWLFCFVHHCHTSLHNQHNSRGTDLPLLYTSSKHLLTITGTLSAVSCWSSNDFPLCCTQRQWENLHMNTAFSGSKSWCLGGAAYTDAHRQKNRCRHHSQGKAKIYSLIELCGLEEALFMKSYTHGTLPPQKKKNQTWSDTDL